MASSSGNEVSEQSSVSNPKKARDQKTKKSSAAVGNEASEGSSVSRPMPPRKINTTLAAVDSHTKRLLNELKQKKVGVPVNLPSLELVGLTSDKVIAYFIDVLKLVTDQRAVNGFTFFVLKWNLMEKKNVLIRMPICRDNVMQSVLLFTPAEFYHVGFERIDGSVRLYCPNEEEGGRERKMIAEMRKYYMNKFMDVKYVQLLILNVPHGYPQLEKAAGVTRHEIKLGLSDLNNMVDCFNAETYAVGDVPQDEFVSHVIRGAQVAEAVRGKEMCTFVSNYLENGKEITPRLISFHYCWSAESHRVQLEPHQYPEFEVIWGPGAQTYHDMHSHYNVLKLVGQETRSRDPPFTFRQRNRDAQYLSTFEDFYRQVDYVKSSKTWDLTKDNPDYQIRAVVHICQECVVLQFECTHNKSNHLLRNIDIIVTEPNFLEEKRMVNKIFVLAESTPKDTFVYFKRGHDFFIGEIKSKIIFDDVDQYENQVVKTTLDLSDIKIGVKDYLISARTLNSNQFQEEWDLLTGRETGGCFQVNTAEVETTVKELNNLLKMRLCNQEGLVDGCRLYAEFCSKEPTWVLVVAEFESVDAGKVMFKLTTRSTMSSVCRSIHDLVKEYFCILA